MRILPAVTAVLLLLGAAGCTSAALAEPDELYTHCGVNELQHGGHWYLRQGGPLTDGNNNPPSGWDNPTQRGRITADGATATFTDRAGHHEVFVERPGATGPLTVCS